MKGTSLSRIGKLEAMNLERWATHGRSWEGGGVGCARRVFIEGAYRDPESVVDDMILVLEIGMKMKEERKERAKEANPDEEGQQESR